MKNAVLVAEVNTLKQLVHEALDSWGLEGTTLAIRVHVSLEVTIHVFEDKHELVLGVDDIVEADNVLVFELFHERYFADGCRRGALFGVEVDFF